MEIGASLNVPVKQVIPYLAVSVFNYHEQEFNDSLIDNDDKAIHTIPQEDCSMDEIVDTQERVSCTDKNDIFFEFRNLLFTGK